MNDSTIGTAYVYFIQVGDDPTVKISSTIHTLDAELASLQIANHPEPRLLGAIDVRVGFGEKMADRIDLGLVTMRLEDSIQHQFAAEHIHGDWFNLTDEVREFIQTSSNVN